MESSAAGKMAVIWFNRGTQLGGREEKEGGELEEKLLSTIKQLSGKRREAGPSWNGEKLSGSLAVPRLCHANTAESWCLKSAGTVAFFSSR